MSTFDNFTMNTSDLVTKLADNWGMSKAETRRLLDTIVQTFGDKLVRETSFTIPGLGTFSTNTRSERKSYNPHYKQYMKYPPKRVVDFNASKSLKEDLRQAGSDDE